jgi:hypothetical protein
MGIFLSSQAGRAVALLLVQGPNDVGDVEEYAREGAGQATLGPAWDMSWHGHPATTSHCVLSREPVAVRCEEVMVVTSMCKVVKEWVIALVGTR